MAKIVLFGGNGFIGKHLVASLAQDKSNTIAVFDRFGSYQVGKERPFSEYTNVELIPGDFSNREEVGQALEGADFVFHLISTTNPAASNNDPFVDIDTNLRNSVELFDLCVEKGIKKVIFTSSGGTVYGDVDSEKINEQILPQPLSPYGIGKLGIEHYLRYFKHKHGLSYIVYRIANPYGPGQNIFGKQGVVPIFMHRYLTNEPLTIYGDGSMRRDYLYIDDLVRMIVGSFNKENRHEVYNLGSGTGTTVNQLVSAIEDCAGYSVKKTKLDAPATYIQNSVLDISLFTSEFGIKPSVKLDEGIRKTWTYVKSIK